MSATFCDEVDRITDRIAGLNERLRRTPAGDVAAEIGRLAADFGELVNRSLADLGPDQAARALRMASELRELAEAERR